MASGSVDHLQSPRHRWWLIVLMAALTLACGTVGTWQYEHEHFPEAHHGLSPLYHAAQMLVLHTVHLDKGVNVWIECGRWLGAATFFSATAMLLGRRLRREFRLLRLRFWSDHHVICGLGEKGWEIARGIKARQPAARVVVIDPVLAPPLAERCDKEAICMLAADAAQPRVLEQARVARAREIIVITPEDATNVRIAAELCLHKPPPGRTPSGFVHLSDIHLREALQEWSEANASAPFRGPALHFFDVFDNEARRVLLELPLDGAGIGKTDGRSVHLVLLGFSRMGRSLALRAAKMGHFANGKPLRISVIDRNGDQHRERFLFRHPVLAGNGICQLAFHTMEVESLQARRQMEQWAEESDTLLHVAVCLDNDARAIEVALRFRRLLQGHPDRNLLVRIRSHRSLAPILEMQRSPGQAAIMPFGMIEGSTVENAFRHEHAESLARAIHEHFLQQRAGRSPGPAESDPSSRDWEGLREDFRESNRQQADHLGIKLRAIGCEAVDTAQPGSAIEALDRGDVELLAPIEHRRWLAERWLAGWQHGTPSDKEQRRSEHLVPWDKLPDWMRRCAAEGVAAIPGLLAKASPPLKVVRRNSSGQDKGHSP